MLSEDDLRHLECNITITYYLWVCCIHWQLEAMQQDYCYIIAMRSTVIRLCSLTGLEG